MQLLLRDNIPFVSIFVIYKDTSIEIPSVLVDTGSATTILSADLVQIIQITPSPEDSLYTIRGVGGSEVVFSRKVDYLKLGEYMDYGFEINGILGMDFLVQAGTIINLRDMKIEFNR
ncbi:MAG: clan AA aspartic protease [Caldilineales bacterium]|nr:clan AA aspartic protease [Caldilineales bacterium]